LLPNPLIGVVTVTYNSAEVLVPFLQCVFQQAHTDFILFAVDNASSDNTVRLLHDSGDERLRIICNHDNRGVAAANNQGIRAAIEAGCTSVLLLNNDTEFDSNLFSVLEEGLAKYDAEMICPKIMYFGEPDRIWAAGGRFQPWLGYRTAHLGADEIDIGQHDFARLVTYVPTCCVLIKSEVFDKVGLMDERYFVYVDDVDFMYRAMKMKIKLAYTHEAELLHKVGRLTGGEDSAFSHRFCTRNRVFFMLRHFGITASAPALILYQLYFLVSFLTRKFSFDSFCIKERAVMEGFDMWKASSITKRW
jgi:GT2 family glycosyltransferase